MNWGGWEKGVPAALTLSGGAFDIHASVWGRRACGTFFLKSFCRSIPTN